MTIMAKVLNHLVDEFKLNRNYLEIGCFQNATFKKVRAANKIGVDPRRGGTHRMTSDHFFQNYLPDHNPTIKFDLVFVDGFHEKEQVKRDIQNSLNWLQPNGIVVVHDCLPTREEHQLSPAEFYERYEKEPPAGKAWTGDVWKGIVETRTWEWPDICTLKEQMGFGIVLPRKNTNPIPSLVYQPTWKDFLKNRDWLLNVVYSRQDVIEFIRNGR